MADKTGIAWTDATWNPGIYGCTEVSPGCANCYAAVQAERLGSAFHQANYAGLTRPAAHGGRAWTGEVRTKTERPLLQKPLSWSQPRRIFVNSMSDVFHEAVPDAHIDAMFGVMAASPRHTFQILTKRPERMRDYMRALTPQRVFSAYSEMFGHTGWLDRLPDVPVLPLANVWLGVSCEDQQRADERIPVLLDTPAAVRFISAEPLLGPIMLGQAGPTWLHSHDRAHDTARLDWVIVGGESGPLRRPFDVAWAEDIQRQCALTGVAYFGKQADGLRSGVPLPGAAGLRAFPAVA